MVKRLGHLCLGTPQLEQMIEFYQSYCDGTIVHQFINPQGERYGAMLRISDSATFLELFNDQKIEVTANPPFRHLSFQVEDIGAHRQLLAAQGAAVEVKRGRTDGILQFWCNDPDGNQVEFTQFDEQSIYSEWSERADD